jgi:hypothetical protein
MASRVAASSPSSRWLAGAGISVRQQGGEVPEWFEDRWRQGRHETST